MSLKLICPCDFPPYMCPYDAYSHGDCEYWCGADEPEDIPDSDCDSFDSDCIRLIEFATE